MTSHSPASSPELPEPAWFAVDTPGADFAISFVTDFDNVCDLVEDEEDRTSLVKRLYTADQMNAHYLKGYEAGSAAAALAVPEGSKELLQSALDALILVNHRDDYYYRKVTRVLRGLVEPAAPTGEQA